MSGSRSEVQDFPQGISESHGETKPWQRRANPAPLIALGLLLVVAFSGLFGGQPHATVTSSTPAAEIELQLPHRIRNGEFFEMRINVETKRPFDDLTLAISSSYWHDMTINTMIPAPSEEKSEDGRYLFSFGKIDAGKAFTIKVDGQINPSLFAGTNGEMELRDGDSVVATIPLELKVLP